MRATIVFTLALASFSHLIMGEAFTSPILVTLQTRNDTTSSNSSWDGVTSQLVEAAIDSMNKAWYNETDGRWNSTTAWWLTGNALQSLVDYMYATKDYEYLDQAEGTINKQSGPLAWWPEGGGDFRADSTDDTGWWALALVRLYDITGNSSYLDIAKLDEEYIYGYWNTSTCGGGVLWSISTLEYKNAISNELYIKLAASLYNRSPNDTEYLDRALQAWNWFNASGMINSANLINDGLSQVENSTQCVNNQAPEYTYNQGVILGGLSELYRATGEQKYLDEAKTIADAVVSNSTLSPNGILYEYDCEADNGCDSNDEAFKGIFCRNLAELNALLSDQPYSSYLNDNAQSVWTSDRNASDFYGIHWAGPYTPATVGTQSSVVSLFVANIW